MRALAPRGLAAASTLAIASLIGAACADAPPPAEPETAAPFPTTRTWTLDRGWEIPVDVPASPTQSDWYDLGWETFIAVNWPAQWNGWPSAAPGGVIGGQPNEGAAIVSAATPYAAVWQTYLAPQQAFLEAGADPGTWAAPANRVGTRDDAGRALPVLGGFSKGTASSLEKTGEFNEASDQPYIAQDGHYVSYEIRMNQAEFAYLLRHRYYDAASQRAATANGGTIAPIPETGREEGFDLPAWAQQGALEVKASWRIVSNTQFADRYFTMRAFRTLPDGSVDGPHLFGLVGLHILRLTPQSGSTWFWATFEHVDNVRIDQRPVPDGLTPSFNPGTTPPYPTYEAGYQWNGGTDKPPAIVWGKPLPTLAPVHTSFVPNAIQDGATAATAKYHAMLGTSVWRYYQLIGVLNPAPSGGSYSVPPFNQPANAYQMSNTTMETYQQVVDRPGTGSCFSCHAYAAPAGAATDKAGYPAQRGNQIFTFLFDDAKSSKTDPKGVPSGGS